MPRPKAQPDRTKRWGIVLYVCSLLTLLFPRPAVSQRVVTGHVIEEGTGTPVVAAFVTVWDERGERVAAALTGARGEFGLTVDGPPGRYVLRAERIGYGSAESDTFDLPESGAVHQRLVLSTQAISIEGIDVAAAESTCPVDREEGRRIYELWNEARKALEIATWAEDVSLLQFQARRYERLHRIGVGRVVEERSWFVEADEPPFFSESATALVRDGFVRGVPGQDAYDYFAPDAAVLLSDAFLDAYCFRLRRPGRNERGLIGLAFEPRQERSVLDITGALWLDADSLKLRHLEFEYTDHLLEPGVPPDLRPLFGGRLEFRDLPGGAWIVDHWTLRMPEYHDGNLVNWDLAVQWLTARLGGALIYPDRPPAWASDALGYLHLKEVGGELAALVTEEGVQLLTRELAVLEGTVGDSSRMEPLQGARVRLLGTDRHVTTNTEGRFHFAEATEGRFELVVTHARLDTLGLDTLRADVELVRGDVTRADLAIPSWTTLHARSCGREPGTGTEGIVAGTIRDSGVGEPIRGAGVELRPEANTSGALSFDARTGQDGVYLFCSVPSDVAYSLTPRVAGVEGEARPVRLSAGEVLELDLQVGGVGHVLGVVRNGPDGVPLGSARVVFDGPEDRTVVTDEEGRFDAAGLPSGRYVLEVQHVSFLEVRDEVQVPGGGQIVRLEVHLLPDAIALDPVLVEVERPAFGALVDVYDRMDRMRRLGLGRIFDRREIEESAAHLVSHLVSRVTGVRTRPIMGSRNVNVVLNRNQCAPSVYLDGMRLMLAGGAYDDDGTALRPETIDDFVSILDVEAVEVYRRVSEIPGELFDEQGARCGVIAVWTRR